MMNDYGLMGVEAGRPGVSQYLIFTLAGEKYGAPILNVQEIKSNAPVTRVPNLPDDVKGVLNLRGAIVPIVDLRRKFGLPPASYDQFCAIVVLTIHERVTGVLVDSVSEVVGIADADVLPPSQFAAGLNSDVILGLARVADDLIIVLNIETALLGSREHAAA